ncbi:hypothetical protein SBOR_8992 [Sclerotinia borealis F-4128]|uniref:Uncharacterized protein n=1 Tax=Sclerotinia borealis (strain F-4128) TaxID=1432307 RepID=W9C6U2_SCLBF|nr:hypothetical protein SBOR_8992 [Sclerotinia borealis F-4128]
MASETSSTVPFSSVKARLKGLSELLPDDDKDIEEATKTLLEQQMHALSATITTILEDPKSTVRDRCIYLNELMRCEFVIQRNGYDAINDLGLSAIISHLYHWHKWLVRNNFPITWSKEQKQVTLSVADFSGASIRSMKLAAIKYGLQVPFQNPSGSIKRNIDEVSRDAEIIKADDDDESSTRNVSSDVPSDIPSNIPGNVPSDIPSDVASSVPSDIPSDVPGSVPSDFPSNASSDVADKVDGNAPIDPLETTRSPSDSRPLPQELTSHVSIPNAPLAPRVGTAEGMNAVIIPRTCLSVEIEKRLAATNWGNVRTSQYIRCWKKTLYETAPRLSELFVMRESGSTDEVGDSHVWHPVHSVEKKPYCLHPQMFYDEVVSDFFEQWEGHEEVESYTKGPKGADMMWLALQFWLSFADANGSGSPPQRTPEELALKEDLVLAVGKSLGAPREKIRLFEVTWGTKMRSDDPNNRKRKRAHGFGGENYFAKKI